ncbi:MAG: hypothetical protein GY865_17430 [candidate division Zixibacteria bacterium]|nr:hypothetical protein [candidate division Zixibacteria bacterium]
MNNKYSPRERFEMTMKGEMPEKPDRFAVSLWRHFFHVESSAEQMAEVMIEYQNKYSWDFMKINPRASFHTEDWGNKLDWSTDEFSNHKHTVYAINTPDDWDKIDILPPTAPVLTDHLSAINLIRKKCGPDLPLLMTLFNPVGIARRLVGNREEFLKQLRTFPDKVTGAIERITKTFEVYVPEILNAGADGLFFATLNIASADAMPYEQYNDFCRPFDLRILKAASNSKYNLLHVCDSNNYLKQLSDYPVSLINWNAADPTNINLEDSFEFLGDKTVIGGLDDLGWLLNGTPDEIKNEMNKVKERMAGKRFIFGPGCAINPRVPHENIMAVLDNL